METKSDPHEISGQCIGGWISHSPRLTWNSKRQFVCKKSMNEFNGNEKLLCSSYRTQKMEAGASTDIHTLMFIAALFTLAQVSTER